MIDPRMFENEARMADRKKQSMLGSMGLMFARNLRSAFDSAVQKHIFKVKIEDSGEEAVLKKILGLLHSISNSLKVAQTPGGQQKISIKTPELLTLNKNIEEILQRIEKKNLTVNMPKTQKITGDVKVLNHPEQYPFEKIFMALVDIRTYISKLKLEVPPAQEIKIPEVKIPAFPKTVTMNDSKAILSALKEVRDVLKELPKDIPKMEMPSSISVNNFPPQKYPLPVTHISINALAGTVKTRAVTVTSSLTPLPGEVLDNRRSWLMYNNSSTTVEIGGSTFAFGDGIPVAAGTWGPALDAGSRTIIYGRVASGSADVRILEISDIPVGR